MKPGIVNRIAGALTACAALSAMMILPAWSGPAELAAASSDSSGLLQKLTGSGSFVYVLANPTGPNVVEVFARNRLTGKLTYQARFPTGGQGDFNTGASEQHALVTDGEYLFAVNPGSNDISVFAMRQDGSLRLLSRTPSGGPSPVSLAVHDDLLYVANQGDPVFEPGEPVGPRIANYTGFKVKRDGKLQPIEGSTVTLNPGDTPTDILFNKKGDLLMGARLGGRTIDSFRVNDNGRLTRSDAINTLGPFGLSFHPFKEDRLLAATFFAPGASSYDVSRRGNVSVISDIIDPPGIDNCWTAVTPNGQLLWTSSFIPGVLSLFNIERDGSLEFVSTHASPDGTTASDITIDATGRFLYSLRPFPTDQISIQVKRITNTPKINGGLADIQEVALPVIIGADGQDTRGPIGLLIIDNPGRKFSFGR
jgi:hypothetical protein